MRYTISFVLASLVGASSALAEVPTVVTDISPVHSLVSQVMGDLGSPVLLLDRGADPHSFQLRPSQARAIAAADLVVWIGPEMTPWLERTLEGSAPGIAQLRLGGLDGLHKLAFAEEAAGHDEDHDAGHDDDHDHDHEGTDPHLWLDVDNAAIWLDALASDLGTRDPANAATYAANAKAAKANLKTLDAAIVEQLEPVHDRPFVVFHDAYGYFATRYHLAVAGEIALGDATAPGAARLSDLRATLESKGAVCIFPEASHDPKLVAQLADGTGVRIGAALDPEGSALPPGPELYATLLTALATTIADCLGQP